MRIVRLLLSAMFLLPAVFGQKPAIFDFHSGFWVNLHHFLYEQAMSPAAASDSHEWRRAVDYYRANLVKKDMLDRDMEAINNTLSDRESAASLKGAGMPPELVRVLQDTAAEYREHWWPAHDRVNRDWIAAVQPFIQKYGAMLTGELAAAYGTTWPAGSIRTDVAEYANWGGAYTTLFPTHITVSAAAPANAGRAALEVLFHEASHALILNLRDALSQQARAEGMLLRRRDLWHALLFYTTGEIVARHLDSYSPYAIQDGLYERSWTGVLPVFEKDWKPYLDGKTDRTTAVRKLVEDYSAAPAR